MTLEHANLLAAPTSHTRYKNNTTSGYDSTVLSQTRVCSLGRDEVKFGSGSSLSGFVVTFRI